MMNVHTIQRLVRVEVTDQDVLAAIPNIDCPLTLIRILHATVVKLTPNELDRIRAFMEGSNITPRHEAYLQAIDTFRDADEVFHVSEPGIDLYPGCAPVDERLCEHGEPWGSEDCRWCDGKNHPKKRASDT